MRPLLCLLCLLGLSPAVGEVRIHGVNKALIQQILADLSIAQTDSQHTPMSVEAIEAQHHRAPADILNTLESQGYYDARVSQELFLPTARNLPLRANDWLARYTIHLGEPIRIRHFSVLITGMGQQNVTLQALQKNHPFVLNAVLSHKDYETYKEKLLSRALQLGYLDALMTESRITIDRERHHADIQLQLATGMPYHIGNISFSQAPYPQDFLMSYLPVHSGEPYSTTALLTIHHVFSDADLFKKVRVTPAIADCNCHEVPITIELERKPKNSYNAGLGFGTDTGPRARFGWERRRQHNPGHRILAQTEVSQLLHQVGLQYVIPGQRPATDHIVLGTQIAEEFSRDKKYTRHYDVGVQDFRKRGAFEFLSGVRYTGEVFRDIPTAPKKSSHLLLPSISVIWKEKHQELEKEHEREYGLRLQGTIRSAVGLLLSSTNLLQAELKGKWIHLLGDNSRLLLRAEVGATYWAEPEEVPLSLRYFAGGDNTVRGYAYKSLGPTQTDAKGNTIVVGGRYLTVLSAEFETRIYKQVSAAVFMDAGNATNNWRDRLALSAGFGIRYATPIGLLRVDIARPIEKGKPRPRIHVTFGMDL